MASFSSSRMLDNRRKHGHRCLPTPSEATTFQFPRMLSFGIRTEMVRLSVYQRSPKDRSPMQLTDLTTLESSGAHTRTTSLML